MSNSPDSPAALYAAAYTIGIGLAVGLSLNSLSKNAVSRKASALLLISIVVSGILGAHSLSALTRFFSVDHNTANSTFFGAVLFAMPMIWVLTHALKIRVGLVLAVVATQAPLGMAIGRLGCYVRGCCSGMLYGLDTALVASMIDMGVFLLLSHRMSRVGPDSGQIGLFCIIYGSKRFLLGYAREDTVSMYVGLGVYQMLGLAIATLGTIVLLGQKEKRSDLSQVR